MGVVLALLASPLLGPAVWSPVAQRLSQQTHTVIVPVTHGPAPRSPDEVLHSMLEALPEDQELALIPHSNAGLYVPALTVERSVVGYVFVDSGLPTDYGRVGMAPPALLKVLAQKKDREGLLPVWTDWWDETDVAPLFPDAGTRERVEREQQRLPLSYFTGSLPVPPGWDQKPGAYIAFGDTYTSARQEAAGRAWPVSTLPGRHLHMLVEPEQVAAQIINLLAAIGISPGHR